MASADLPLDLSIIIVNWNSVEYLDKCIASVLKSLSGIAYEIVVIDGGSFDGCKQMLLEFYPQVRFIQCDDNLGFAKLNNKAYQIAQGRYLFFLNPDTEIVEKAVNILFDQLENLPEAGAVGSRLLNGDRSVQTSCIQSFPTIMNQFLDAEMLRLLWPQAHLWGNGILFSGVKEPQQIDVISGACIMVKRDVFEQVGLFSEDYFMYAEDLDLCYKIKALGYENYYIPLAEVIHYGGGSTKKTTSIFSTVMMRESIWKFLRKTRGNCYGLWYRITMFLLASLRLLVLLGLWFPELLRRRQVTWRFLFNKWKAILVWSLGLKADVLRAYGANL